MARSSRSGGGLSFPKAARILRRAEYLRAREKGRGFAEGPLAASWTPRVAEVTRPGAASTGAAVARVGITVSSKVGGSVVRSRVKRRIREAVRHELSGLPAVDLVVVARASAVEAGVAEFRAWLRKAAKRIGGGRP